MSIGIVPFGDEHLEDAVDLVVRCHRMEIDAEPWLPGQFADLDAISQKLQGFMGKGPGVAAVRDGKLAGFQVSITSLFRDVRSAYTPDWGHAAEQDGRRDSYRLMYASLSRQWAAERYLNHYITVLAHDKEAIGAWFSMGFGLCLVDAIRDASPVSGPVADVDIRRAGPEDVEILLEWEAAMWRHLASAPVFIPFMEANGREDRERWLQDTDNALWLAYRDGALVGLMGMEPSTRSDVLLSDKATVCISRAFTEEVTRNGGVGTALLGHALAWARSEGYERCGVDYETANILGSRFWGNKGFRPFRYSLNRRLDDRIS